MTSLAIASYWYVIYIARLLCVFVGEQKGGERPESLFDCQVFHNKRAFASAYGMRGNLKCEYKTLIGHRQDDISHTFPQLCAFISLF